MTFMLDTAFLKSVILFLENTTPTANRTAEEQMHVVEACFWPLPLPPLCLFENSLTNEGPALGAKCVSAHR